MIILESDNTVLIGLDTTPYFLFSLPLLTYRLKVYFSLFCEYFEIDTLFIYRISHDFENFFIFWRERHVPAMSKEVSVTVSLSNKGFLEQPLGLRAINKWIPIYFWTPSMLNAMQLL